MRIATWNVNSIRARHERVIDWLTRADIDVLAMQEIKCRPDQFPAAAFEQAGYQLAIHGLNQWNGVAFASRYPIEEIQTAFPGQPGFGKPVRGQENIQQNGPNGLPQEARALGVTIEGMRLWSLYVPNGRALNDPHMSYKLDWLNTLRTQVTEWLQEDPELPLALMGDWNVAPLPTDCGDPSMQEGESTHISPAERDAFTAFLKPDAGTAPETSLTDVVRPYQPEGFTFWDYQAGKYRRNEGLRIDFILGSRAFNDAVIAGEIAATERAGEGPSDHVPVVCEIDEQLLYPADIDDAPMIF